ncbi:hypothetical protein FA15DRAFT_664795 [Coprinopsis marcescibilis]|uniref:Caffeine-induced death protein 2 n=1 Tax=Coprinopsis marcescibilis TaxID=230819 RepID=A0A5C3LJG8_COPMA|nr:hypothetical protein FA15DRAFT_664795 [Coprinopsis marcescibilis]
MPSRYPELGSLALQAPSNASQTVRVTPATCRDLSLFKVILKEYRKLDDTIVMRLNRANALVRDQERERASPTGNIQNQACTAVWKELTENWKRRTQLIDYCATIVDQPGAENSEREAKTPAEIRKAQAAAYPDQVKRNQLRNEQTVEAIVRRRAVDAFRSRCLYFTPPKTERESAAIWEAAQGH